MENQRLTQLAAYGIIQAIDSRNMQGIITSYAYEINSVFFNYGDQGSGYFAKLKDVKPCLRSINNLDKPIVVEEYNEGREFVPTDELQRLYGASIGSGNEIFIGDGLFGWCDTVQSISTWAEIIDLLNLWQFDYRGWIKQGLALLKED